MLWAAGALAAQHDCLHQCLGEGVIVVGDGHRYAKLLSDLLGFAQDDVQNSAIDRIVGTVDQGGAHLGARLAEAVDTAFALFVAGGIPRQIVVNHSIEVVLQVDAFGQAVGGDQQATISLAQGLDAALAIFGWEFAGDDFECHASKLAGQVFV
ncbi:hypothetical protein RLIN73S_07523 [Rhodanobacter lindaniclasticus]